MWAGLDASQDKNIAKSVMGQNLYEVTWSGDAIRIHNNGSVTANENAVGSNMTDEEKYNKTTVRYKITMRGNSGWYTEGSWNPEYLREWMDFKVCINAPEHQRLYKADMRIIPSDMVFYLVISQDGEGGGSGTPGDGEIPEYGVETPTLEFQIYRHKETFSADYNVRLVNMTVRPECRSREASSICMKGLRTEERSQRRTARENLRKRT